MRGRPHIARGITETWITAIWIGVAIPVIPTCAAAKAADAEGEGRPEAPHRPSVSALEGLVVIAQVDIFVRVGEGGAGLAVAGAQIKHGADALDGDFRLRGES